MLKIEFPWKWRILWKNYFTRLLRLFSFIFIIEMNHDTLQTIMKQDLLEKFNLWIDHTDYSCNLRYQRQRLFRLIFKAQLQNQLHVCKNEDRLLIHRKFSRFTYTIFYDPWTLKEYNKPGGTPWLLRGGASKSPRRRQILVIRPVGWRNWREFWVSGIHKRDSSTARSRFESETLNKW